MRKQPLLDAITNAAIIAAALVFVGTSVHQWFVTGGVSTPEPPARYRQGEIVDDIPKAAPAAFRTSDRALFVFVNSHCQYCTASMPFYARLVEAARGAAGIAVVFASREPAETTAAYLQLHGIQADEIAQVEAGRAPRLKLTPTILLVGSDGRVLDVWTGQQDADGEAAVRRVLVSR